MSFFFVSCRRVLEMAEKMEADNEAMVALHQRVEDTHGCTLAETLKIYRSIHFEKAFKSETYK